MYTLAQLNLSAGGPAVLITPADASFGIFDFIADHALAIGLVCSVVMVGTWVASLIALGRAHDRLDAQVNAALNPEQAARRWGC